MKTERKSIDYLTGSIDRWVRANQRDGRIVEFYGSFWAVNPENDFEVEDDRMFAYGSKETLAISMEELAKLIINDKEDFVNL